MTLENESRLRGPRLIPEVVEMCANFVIENGLDTEGIFRCIYVHTKQAHRCSVNTLLYCHKEAAIGPSKSDYFDGCVRFELISSSY